MFTLFIHTLEVLANFPNGLTTVDKIVEMGCEYTHKQVVSALRSLESDGYVTSVGKGKSREWQITEKAIEHCEHVTRAYSKSDWTRMSPQEMKQAQTPEYSGKMLVNRAVSLMRNRSITAHIALEEAVSAWKQNRVHTDAVDYYRHCSDAELERLIKEVEGIHVSRKIERVITVNGDTASVELNPAPLFIWTQKHECLFCGSDANQGYTSNDCTCGGV